MKSLLVIAAMAASFATASAASAHDNVRGHWEWRIQPSVGPRGNVPSRTRVWVAEPQSAMADCDCPMMHADAAGCMMDMRGKTPKPSAG